MFDTDGTGEVDKYEFVSACRALGLTESDSKLVKMFGQIDTNNSGFLDFSEFKRAARKIMVTITLIFVCHIKSEKILVSSGVRSHICINYVPRYT